MPILPRQGGPNVWKTRPHRRLQRAHLDDDLLHRSSRGASVESKLLVRADSDVNGALQQSDPINEFRHGFVGKHFDALDFEDEEAIDGRKPKGNVADRGGRGRAVADGAFMEIAQAGEEASALVEAEVHEVEDLGPHGARHGVLAGEGAQTVHVFMGKCVETE